MPVADKSKWSPKSFHSIAELSADLDKIEAAHQAGTLSTDGGWTVGQNLMHCGILMKNAYDGFEMNAPAPVRMLCSLFLKPIATKPTSQMKPGFKLPKKAKELLPEDSITFEEGLAMMRSQIARIESGEQFSRPSPLLGKMTHEKWINLHLNHCRMHFGYLNY